MFSKNTINTSSDISIYKSPIFDMSGATKIISGITISNSAIHVVNDNVINLNINFVGNLEFLSGSTFTYNIHKFNQKNNIFDIIPTIKSRGIISNSIVNYEINENIVFDDLSDNEFLLKGSFNYPITTNILSKLNLFNKSDYSYSNIKYNSYNEIYDYYFVILNKASTPKFSLSPTNQSKIGNLITKNFLPNNENIFFIDDKYVGSPIVTLNGSVLANNLDYTLIDNKITLNENALYGSVLNIIYVLAGGQNGLYSNSFVINKSILSGVANSQSNEKVYFNTDTNKFEIYLELTPNSDSDLILVINGSVLSYNIDYYMSASNKKTIILETQTLVFGDVITIINNTNISFNGLVNSNNIEIYWEIDPPKFIEGVFRLELSYNKDFTTLISFKEINYTVGIGKYFSTLELPKKIKVYYRVVNIKNFKLITGDIISTTSISDIISVTNNSLI